MLRAREWGRREGTRTPDLASPSPAVRNPGHDLFSRHQAYQELRSDRHPVVVIAGADIAAILVKAGLGTPEAVWEWLIAEFPTEETIA